MGDFENDDGMGGLRQERGVGYGGKSYQIFQPRTTGCRGGKDFRKQLEAVGRIVPGQAAVHDVESAEDL